MGDPDPDFISTSYVERQNLTMRMGMRRFTRLTNGFSKKVENLTHAVSLHYMHYNFAHPHQSLTIKREGRALLATFCRTAAQATAVANFLAMLLCGLGGAITPVSALPDWAAAIAPISPIYWTMSGFTAVISGGSGADVLLSVVVLVAVASATTAIAVVQTARHGLTAA
jgi:hypothetical protein